MSAPPPGWVDTVAHARAAGPKHVVIVPSHVLIALADHVAALEREVDDLRRRADRPDEGHFW